MDGFKINEEFPNTMLPVRNISIKNCEILINLGIFYYCLEVHGK